ncbi:MAG: hypothetical protein Fur0037_29430 [Planctomycetota bacterium]
MRWLTVEEGIYDHATVLVNGTPVWTNQPNGHHQDLSWQLVEIPIPMADNNPSVQIEWHLTSDPGLQLGGWNIDNVEVGTRFTPPLDVELRMTPEQAAGNSPVNLVINTPAAAPFALVLGSTGGPTLFPGIPPLAVGGPLASFSSWTNSLGIYSATFNAPVPPSALGLQWFMQVIAIDAGSNFVVSNQGIGLFTL